MQKLNAVKIDKTHIYVECSCKRGKRHLYGSCGDTSNRQEIRMNNCPKSDRKNIIIVIDDDTKR
jgi:hypothetical protein